MNYTESLTWNIRIEAQAEFPDDYDGEQDGFVWRDEFQRTVQPAVVAAVARELSRHSQYRLRGGNHGLPGQDEIVLHLDLQVKPAAAVASGEHE